MMSKLLHGRMVQAGDFEIEQGEYRFVLEKSGKEDRA